MLEKYPLPENYPKTIADIGRALRQILLMSRNERSAKVNRVEKAEVESYSQKYLFPVTRWRRQVNGAEYSFGVVDKTKMKGGYLLTALAPKLGEVYSEGSVYLVNDSTVLSGIRRVTHFEAPNDVAPIVIESYEASEAMLKLDKKLTDPQLKELNRAMATVIVNG
jgi:hypothetical protein